MVGIGNIIVRPTGGLPRSGPSRRYRSAAFIVGLILLTGSRAVFGQQVVDTSYVPPVTVPAYPAGTGPRVSIDAAHHNPDLDGPLLALRRLLDADGYRVRPLNSPVDERRLESTDVLVIVDALAARNLDDWSLPTPSALAAAEQQSLVAWVRAGGALLLVADHMPFAGAASELCERLGLEVLNGFAIDTVSWDPITFRRSDGTLRAHPIVDGDGTASRVDSVFTYWGHAFRPRSGDASPLLVFPEGTVSYQPRRAWRFEGDTEIRDVGGWAEGVALHVGRGRVVVLGDSGLLMAHLVGPTRQRVGMNAPEGGQNALFMRNVFRWLTGARS